MTRRSFHRLVSLTGSLLLACGAANALAAKPISNVYADVSITFGGDTYGFYGVEQQFTQTQNGGRIVFDVTTLGTPEYRPLPQIDVSHLDDTGNYWEVVTSAGRHSYMFSGICASETFSTNQSGLVVQHLYLNCKTLQTPG